MKTIEVDRKIEKILYYSFKFILKSLILNQIKMNEIIFRSLDLCIKKTEGGTEYVAIKASVAFDEGFVKHCRDNGIMDFVPYEPKSSEIKNKFDDEEE